MVRGSEQLSSSIGRRVVAEIDQDDILSFAVPKGSAAGFGRRAIHSEDPVRRRVWLGRYTCQSNGIKK